MSDSVVVIDASVGVKWFHEETGTVAAENLLRAHRRGETLLAVDTLFLYEVVAAGARGGGPGCMERVWSDLQAFDLAIVPPGAELMAAAAVQRQALGCSPYDAFAPGLAALLRAPLVSADARAHGRYPGVRLIGTDTG
jgi:predicted nucleic acid-binding protein